METLGVHHWWFSRPRACESPRRSSLVAPPAAEHSSTCPAARWVGSELGADRTDAKRVVENGTIQIMYSYPQIDGKVNHHEISRDLLFHLFGDDYMLIMYGGMGPKQGRKLGDTDTFWVFAARTLER